jgi:primosomal protein N' (replication factor Y) (superfamily II helicase)
VRIIPKNVKQRLLRSVSQNPNFDQSQLIRFNYIVPILFVHPRRGLFQLTKCDHCGYKFECDNCDNNLTTLRTFETNMQLVCSQCQSYYSYPVNCPKCGNSKINSIFGGIDDLIETIQKEYKRTVIKVDSKQKINWQDYSSETDEDLATIFATTRIFDPSIDYSVFSKIIFVRAENLLASPDYLVTEEVYRALAEVMIGVNKDAEIIFETLDPDNEFFLELAKVNRESQENISIIDWYSRFISKETNSREKFMYPPFWNILLITTQEKTKEKSLKSIGSALEYMKSESSNLKGIKISSVYPARYLKRKGYFSHHFIIRYPKQFEHYFALQADVKFLAGTYRLQVRLNPRHLF